MKKSNVKKISLKVPVIIMACTAAILIGGGSVYAYFGEGSFTAEHGKTVTVKSIQDIVDEGTNIFNDDIVLANDIHVTDNSFCVGGAETVFSGTFDGCGYTVYLDYQSGLESSSFFSAIGEGGTVKNTRFVFTNVTAAGNSFCGVAKINYGTVQDCAVEYTLRFDAKDGMFTPFVAVNCGTVKNIVARGTVVYGAEAEDDEDIGGDENDGEDVGDDAGSDGDEDGDDENVDGGSASGEDDAVSVLAATENGTESVFATQKNEDEKKIAFAAACVYNYGVLKNIISLPRFIGFYCTSRDNYLAGRSENVSIASVCAFSDVSREGDKAASTESGLVSINEKALYTSDDLRLDKYESFSSLIFDVNGALIKTEIENTYDFNNTVWEIDETALWLKLKVNSKRRISE